MASNSTKRSYPQKQLMPDGITAVPTSLTALSTTDSIIFQVVITNTSAGTLTFTLQTAGAVPLYKTYSITTTQPLVQTYDEGVVLKGGVSWQASGSGLVGEIFGYEAG